MLDTVLVIMARYPETGTTKTRLTHRLSSAEVIHLYRAFLADLAERFSEKEYATYWAYTPSGADFWELISSLNPERSYAIHTFPQQGEKLGDRMHHIFKKMYEAHFTRIIVIGSDIPQLGGEMIKHAITALDDADVVLGPADDGGYYLIAMRHPHDIFSGIPMSTPQVRQMTIEAAEQQGLTVHQLAPLFDIDDYDDLLRLIQLLTIDRTSAPVTAAYLTTLGMIT